MSASRVYDDELVGVGQNVAQNVSSYLAGVWLWLRVRYSIRCTRLE